MIRVSKLDVPLYLRKGSFYEALSEDDADLFEVPFDCCKVDPTVKSDAELKNLLRSASFWGLHKIPLQVVSFVLSRGQDPIEVETFPAEYVESLNAVIAVKRGHPTERVSIAIQRKVGVEVVTWLHQSEGYALPSTACIQAAKVDDVETLTYLREQGYPWDTSITNAAITHGNIKCLKYCYTMGCPLSANSMQLAAATSTVLVMELLNTFGLTYPDSVYLDCSCLAVVQHLRAVGCEWQAKNCEVFAQQGKLDCLAYAHSDGSPWDANVCVAAAAHGHLNCLEYAHLNGCPWEHFTTSYAVLKGHFECFKYAHQRGCAVSPESMGNALQRFRGWFVFYLVLNGCPSGPLYVCVALILLNVAAWHTFYTCTPVWGLTEYVHLFGSFHLLMQLLISIYGDRLLYVVSAHHQLVLRIVLAVIHFAGMCCVTAVNIVNNFHRIASLVH